MNDAKVFMIAKRLLESGKPVDPALVVNPESDLRSLLA